LNVKILNEREFSEIISRGKEESSDMVTTVDTNNRVGTTEKSSIWSEKWRPEKMEDLVGNKGIVGQLVDFLRGKTRFKSALLSGHSGVGKTTAAHIACKEVGYKPVEFNASDVRNRSEIVKHIKSKLNLHSLTPTMSLTKRVLIMDEIDGMTSDRGGLPELNLLIKTSSIPIICICNDRNNPKIRALAFKCLDLRFRRLDARQILPRIKYILTREGKQLKDSLIFEVIKFSNGDLRYTLNTIQNLLLRKTISNNQVDTLMKKNIARNVFEVSSEIFQRRTIQEKIDLYFEDYSIVPLMVYENYLKLGFASIDLVDIAIESISLSDIVDKHIHGYNQEWGLSPYHAFLSCILPTRDKILMKKIDFPIYLGQNSKRMKNLRNLNDSCLHSHRRIRTNKTGFRLYVMNLMVDMYIDYLSAGEIQKCIGLLGEYDFVREDLNNLSEILLDGEDRMKSVVAKNKLALTKAYRKMERILPYSYDEENKKQKVSEKSEEEEAEEDGNTL
jgi:replication factor C subunit 1